MLNRGMMKRDFTRFGALAILYLSLAEREMVIRSKPLQGITEGDERALFVRSEKVSIFREGRRV